MKTTLYVEDGVFRAAKRKALEENIPLTRLLENALREYLQPPPPPRAGFRVKLLIRRGKLVPGVDLADRVALYDRMEGKGDRKGIGILKRVFAP